MEGMGIARVTIQIIKDHRRGWPHPVGPGHCNRMCRLRGSQRLPAGAVLAAALNPITRVDPAAGAQGGAILPSRTRGPPCRPPAIDKRRSRNRSPSVRRAALGGCDPRHPPGPYLDGLSIQVHPGSQALSAKSRLWSDKPGKIGLRGVERQFPEAITKRPRLVQCVRRSASLPTRVHRVRPVLRAHRANSTAGGYALQSGTSNRTLRFSALLLIRRCRSLA